MLTLSIVIIVAVIAIIYWYARADDAESELKRVKERIQELEDEIEVLDEKIVRFERESHTII